MWRASGQSSSRFSVSSHVNYLLIPFPARQRGPGIRQGNSPQASAKPRCSVLFCFLPPPGRDGPNSPTAQPCPRHRCFVLFFPCPSNRSNSSLPAAFLFCFVLFCFVRRPSFNSSEFPAKPQITSQFKLTSTNKTPTPTTNSQQNTKQNNASWRRPPLKIIFHSLPFKPAGV